ncbi:MAG: AIR carboxylase family protein, partial [[Eubacterium] sulci]|nr:AIR carboxylase family protein [[Eubacterium] sulci]
IPVATVAIDGSKNAALLAIEILALSDDNLSKMLIQKREEDKEKVLNKNAAIEAKFGGR